MALNISHVLFLSRSSALPNRMEYADVQRAVDYLSSKTTCRPELAIICGSGLGSLVEMLKDKEPFSYEDIPHFAVGSGMYHIMTL